MQNSKHLNTNGDCLRSLSVVGGYLLVALRPLYRSVGLLIDPQTRLSDRLLCITTATTLCFEIL